jgi:DNA-binding CsgD family transcriptional regulator
MLAGRAAETARLRQLIEAARGGRSDALVMQGDPGVGKTALLRFAVEEGRDFAVLECRCVESESALPFAGLHDLIRPLLTSLEGLPEVQAAALRGALAIGPPDGVGERFAVYAGALGLVAGAAEISPVLCVIDDAQWLDHESAEALIFVARRLEADAVAVLLATRAGAGELELSGIEAMRIEALPEEDAVEMLTGATRFPVAPHVAERLARETGGNPLAMLESAHALTAEQLAGRQPLMGPLPIGPSTERLFSPRIEALSLSARRALLVAAAADESDLGPILAAAHELGGDASGLEEAETAGLIAVADARVLFAHPLVRSAAYVSAPPTERRAAHRELANALDEPRRAWQLALSAFGPDERIAQALESAAMAARARKGFASASAALDRSARLSEHPPAQARRLYLAADAARLAGQCEHASRLLETAVECDKSGREEDAITHLRGRVELLRGHTDAAQSILLAAAKTVEARDRSRAAALLSEAAFAAMIGGDGDAAVSIASQAREVQDTDRGLVSAITGLVLGTALFRAGRLDAGLRLVVEAADIVAETPDETIEPEYVIHAAHVLSWVGEYRRARALLDATLQDIRATGALGVLPWALYTSADLDTRTGSWSAARADACEAVSIARDTGNQLWLTYALGCLTMLDAMQGRESEARTHAAEAEDLARQLGIELPRKVADALGLLELSLGRPENAIPHLEAAGHAGSRLALPDLVEAYTRAQRPLPEAIGGLLKPGKETAAGVGALFPHCRGIVAGDDFDGALKAALEAYEAAGMPFGRARVALLLGERLRRAGRRAESREHLRAALDGFTQLGAAIWAERARGELRATGERVGSRRREGEDRLTAQELQVARVVARGATNKEAAATLFLSAKTIEYHLGHVYSKLRVRSRTELAHHLAHDPELQLAGVTRPDTG